MAENLLPCEEISIKKDAFKFRLADHTDKIDGSPKLYFDVIYPDGTHHETEPVDISIFLFEALGSEIDALSQDSKAQKFKKETKVFRKTT